MANLSSCEVSNHVLDGDQDVAEQMQTLPDISKDGHAPNSINDLLCDGKLEDCVDVLNPVKSTNENPVFNLMNELELFEEGEKFVKMSQAFEKLSLTAKKIQLSTVKSAARECGMSFTMLCKQWSKHGAAELGVTCYVYIDSVLVATADGQTKKDAKIAVFKKIVSLLQRPFVRIKYELRLVTSDEPLVNDSFTDDISTRVKQLAIKRRSKLSDEKRSQTEAHHSNRFNTQLTDEETVVNGDMEISALNSADDYMSMISCNTKESGFMQRCKVTKQDTVVQDVKSAKKSTFSDSTVAQLPKNKSTKTKQKKVKVVTSRAASKSNKKSSKLDLSEFVIVRSQSECNEILSVLEASVRFCHMEIKYCEDSLTDNKSCSCVVLGGQIIGYAFGDSTQNARLAAAQMAFDYLSSNCCAIIIKDLTNVLIEDAITPTQV